MFEMNDLFIETEILTKGGNFGISHATNGEDDLPFKLFDNCLQIQF